jgi:hypothetical protein
MALVATLLEPAAAGASRLDPRPNALEMVRRAERIVVARCLSSEPRILQPGGVIFTFVEFDTTDLVKGKLPARFTLRLLGGTVGGRTIDADGTPTFTPGDEVILLLGPDNAEGYPVIGMQSFYRTSRDPAGWIVADPVYDLDLYRAGTREPINQYSTSEYGPLHVADFVWSIRQALDGQKE